MDRLNHEGWAYRVLLTGIADDSEEGRDSFCKDVSEKYGISFSLLRTIITRCPIILKKNLLFKQAEALAKILSSHGALVSVEKRVGSSGILLEFQEIAPPQLALETTHFGRTEGGAWSVVGKVRNISGRSLEDIWLVAQFFDDLDDILTFEEVPIPFNPFPSNASSPFKVVVGGGLSVQKISIAFKNASGSLLGAVDRRKKQGWREVRIKDPQDWFPSYASPPVIERSPDPKAMEREEGPLAGIGSIEEKGNLPTFEPEVSFPPAEEDEEGDREDQILEEAPLGTPGESPLDAVSENVKVEGDEISPKVEEGEAGGIEDMRETGGGSPDSPPVNRGDAEVRLNDSIFEEATELLVDVSHGTGEKEESDSLPFPWLEDFRNSVGDYDQNARDIFSVWFEAQRKEGKFENTLHSLLTILVHARFDQMSRPEKALERTQEVFDLLLPLDRTSNGILSVGENHYSSEENWMGLFRKALPKVRQISGQIIERSCWDASRLERLIQIIPHMSEKSGRLATHWMSQLIPDAVVIDFSNSTVCVKESLYRVAARLGVVDPHFDYYQGRSSAGDVKIQSFARTAFPKCPRKVEEPMSWAGMGRGEGGHCFPIEPECGGCLFETFCPKLYLDFNPSEKGMTG
jgi:hypothetical protein